MISPTSLLVTLGVVAIVFGTRRLRNMGEDMGIAIKNFRKGLQGELEKPSASEKNNEDSERGPHV